MNDVTRLIILVVCDRLSLLFQNTVGSVNVVACAPIVVHVLLELGYLPDGILIIPSVIHAISSATRASLAHSVERHIGNQNLTFAKFLLINNLLINK